MMNLKKISSLFRFAGKETALAVGTFIAAITIDAGFVVGMSAGTAMAIVGGNQHYEIIEENNLHNTELQQQRVEDLALLENQYGNYKDSEIYQKRYDYITNSNDYVVDYINANSSEDATRLENANKLKTGGYIAMGAGGATVLASLAYHITGNEKKPFFVSHLCAKKMKEVEYYYSVERDFIKYEEDRLKQQKKQPALEKQ